MLGLISREILRYQYLLARSEEIWVTLHCFFFFFCETYVIFMMFFIYIIFFIPEYLTDMCLLCVDVGPVKPVDYVRNRCHPWPGAAPTPARGPTTTGELPTDEAEKVFR
jgi:hypothetical protein